MGDDIGTCQKDGVDKVVRLLLGPNGVRVVVKGYDEETTDKITKWLMTCWDIISNHIIEGIRRGDYENTSMVFGRSLMDYLLDIRGSNDGE